MELIQLSTGKVMSFAELRKTYRNVAFPKDLANADLSDYDVAVVATDVMPKYNPATESLELSEPTLIDGQWRRTWTRQLLPKPEIATITMRQCRLELNARDLLDDVESAIAQQPKPVQIEWEYATQVDRGSDLVAQLAALLGFDNQDVDQFFEEASQR